MKKLFLLLTVFLFSVSACFAEQIVQMNQGSEYLYFSKSKIKSITSNNPAIISAQRISTIKDNEQQVMFSAKRTGKAIVRVETEKGLNSYSIEVVAGKALRSEQFIELDIPGIFK